MAKILSCEEVGEFDTYDLEVDHPDHQYYLSTEFLLQTLMQYRIL